MAQHVVIGRLLELRQIEQEILQGIEERSGRLR